MLPRGIGVRANQQRLWLQAWWGAPLVVGGRKAILLRIRHFVSSRVILHTWQLECTEAS